MRRGKKLEFFAYNYCIQYHLLQNNYKTTTRALKSSSKNNMNLAISLFNTEAERKSC